MTTYAIRTTVRRVVYTRPAEGVPPLAAEGAGYLDGPRPGRYAAEFAPPTTLAEVVYYPDAAATPADPAVVAVERDAPWGRGRVTRYATLAAFVAAVLTPLGLASLDALAPGTPAAGSLLRWTRTELAATS